MPGNFMVTDEEALWVAGFVRSLSRVRNEPLGGDPGRGQELYGGAKCATCHIVEGQGSSIGPELTMVGARRGPEFLRTAVDCWRCG